MSSLPVRERVIRELVRRTGAVRRLEMYDERDLPITVLQEGDDNAAEGLYGMTQVTTQVSIARALRMSGVKGDDWYTELNTALANLIKEIFKGGDELGGLALGMNYVSGSVDLLTDAGQGAGVAVTVDVRYAFVHGNPYSQDADSEYVDVEPDEPDEPEVPDEEEDENG
jgi:hypothetical protein